MWGFDVFGYWFGFSVCSLCDEEPVRHAKDHRDETCSRTSTPLGPAAPMTCASGPFSCRGAACTSGGCEISPFPAVAVEARLGFASWLVCFVAVNPELPPLRNACFPSLFTFAKAPAEHQVTCRRFLLPPSRLCEHSYFLL